MNFSFAVILALAVISTLAAKPTPTTANTPDELPSSEIRDPIHNLLPTNLEPRQQNQNNQALAVATQAPAVTTFGMNVLINGVVTYSEIIYTQTFAAVPDQLPSPGSGEIGYGTLMAKRQAPPAADEEMPLVIEIPYVQVEVPVTPIIIVIEVVMIPPGWSSTTTMNGSSGSMMTGTMNGTANGTIRGTGHGTGYRTGYGTGYGTGYAASTAAPTRFYNTQQYGTHYPIVGYGV